MCKDHCDTFKKSNQMSLNVALYQIWITFVEHHMEKVYEQKSQKKKKLKGKWHVILVSSVPHYDWETWAQLSLVQPVFIESKTLENKDEWGDYDTVEGTDI